MAEDKPAPPSMLEAPTVLEIPAYYSNRFFVLVDRDTVRLTFAEQQGTGNAPHLRTAVRLPHQDAVELRDMLTQLLEPPAPEKESVN